MKKSITIIIALFVCFDSFALFRLVTITPENSSKYGVVLSVTQQDEIYYEYTLELILPEHDFSEPLGIELAVNDEEGVLVSKTNWAYLVDTKDPNSFGRAIDGFSFRVRTDLVPKSTLKLHWFETAEMTFNLKDFPVRKESENQSAHTTPASRSATDFRVWLSRSVKY